MGATQTTAEPMDEWIADQLQEVAGVTTDALPGFLGDVAISDADVSDGVANATLVIDGYPSLSVPGSAGVEFLLGEPAVSTAEVDVSLVLETEWALAIEGIELTARVDNGVLRPAPADDGTRADHVEFTTEVDITLDHTWEFGIEGFEGVDMTPAEIAKTGILIEASDIVLDVSPTELSPAIAEHDEFDESAVEDGFVGLFIGDASVSFPEAWPLPTDLTLRGATIGSGGFSGVIAYEPDDLTFDDGADEYVGEAAATLGDFSFGIDAVQIEFVQTALSTCSVSGELFVPYVDERVTVDLGFDMEGGLAVELTGLVDAGEPAGGEVGKLVSVDVADAFTLDIDGFGIVVGADTFAASISGAIRPRVDAVDLPDVEVDDLTINADGTVEYDGSWIDVPDQGSTELDGVELEVSKLAVGTRDDGWRYLAFSGAIHVVEGIPAGASAEGLRVAWDPSGENDPTVSFEGIGIEFTIPDTLAFKGTVAYDGENGEYYGDIDLDLIALDTTISATLIVGEKEDASGRPFTYLGVSIDASLPVGIPLFSTGLSIYGMGALYAHNMEPDRGDREWYALSGEGDESWYHAGDEPGVDDFQTQWAAKRGSFGFGAGVTIGTGSDNGFALTSDLLLVIAFPGPVIMVEGRAELLSPGEEVDTEAGLRTLAVLDGDAGDLTFGIDAQYTKASENATLLDIRAGVEAYYDFTDPSAWYLNLGRRDPEDDRVRAELLIFSAEGYLMLNADRVATGARVGYGEDFSFGPLAVDFEAFIEGHVLVSWQPTHFSGAVELYGAVELSAFGIGASITASAALAAEAVDPFHITGEVSVELGTPWPLPDPEATVSLEWGPTPEPPAVPAPLSGVALGHERVTTRWPLPRAAQVDEVGDSAYAEALLEPDYATVDAGGERLLGYDDDLPSPPDDTENGPADPPRVPPDVRPELTFTTGVVDEGDVGVNASTSDAWTVIGDPEGGGPVEARYLLQDVSLQRWSESEESYVDEGPVYGSWAPLPDTRIGAGGAPSDDGTPPVANTKLRLWSVNPYDYGRDTGGAWEEGIDRLLGAYPCYGDGRCFPLAGNTIGEELTREVAGEEFDGERITHEDDGWPQFFRDVDELDAPPEVDPVETEVGFIEALCYPGPNRKHDPEDLTEVVVALDGFRRSVELTLVVGRQNTRLSATALGYEGDRKGSAPIETREIRSTPEFLAEPTGEEASRGIEVDPPTPTPFERRTVTFAADGGISHVLIRSTGPFGIVEVCEATVPIDALGADGVEGPAHARDQLVRWSEEPTVLEPNERYRLVIDTVVEARGIDGGPLSEFEHRWPDGDGAMTEMAYFETTGPPALADVSTPFGADDEGEGGSDAFGTLERYIESTVPESTVADGERPSVPRPVYRGYDVGVRFAEAYVESLYAMARRDLRLQLYDEDDRPVRDVDGRLGTARNPWGKAGTHALERHDRTWLSRVAEACGGVEEETLPYEDVLADDDPRNVLDPDTTYEARLVPALVRESFVTGGDRWRNVDEEHTVTHDGAAGEHVSVVSEDGDAAEAVVTLESLEEGDLGDLVPGSDTVRFRGDKRRPEGTYVITAVDGDDDATVALDGVPDLTLDDRTWRVAPTGYLRIDDEDGPVDVTTSLESAPGTTPPAMWDDYVLRTNLRFTDGDEGVAGAVVRYDPDTGAGYRFEIDANDDEYRLVRTDTDGSETMATEPCPSIEAGMDAEIRMQVIGGAIDVFVDDEPTLSVIDADPLPAGTVGIHAVDTSTIDVAEVFVEDFRTDGESPVAYRFPFTTSRFSNFVHQIQSFPDTAWTADGAALIAMVDGSDGVPDVTAAATSLPVDDPKSPDGAETRAYDAVIEALAPGVTPPIDGIDATWLTAAGGPVGLLVRSPEPIDWDRTTGALDCASDPLAEPQPPETTKVTDVRFEGEEDGGTGTADGSVEVLVDQRMTPEEYVLERRLPGGRGFAPEPVGAGFAERFPETFEGGVYSQIPRHGPGELPDIPFPQDLIEWERDEPPMSELEDPTLEVDVGRGQFTEVEPIDDVRISGLATRVAETFDRYDIDTTVSEDDPLAALEATTIDTDVVADLDLSDEEYELLERQAARVADHNTIDATSGRAAGAVESTGEHSDGARETSDGAEETSDWAGEHLDGAARSVDLGRLAAVTSGGSATGDPDAEWFVDEDGLSAETEGWTGFVRPAGTTPTVWETTVALGSSATAGLLFRVRDETHYLVAALSTADERVSLRRRDGDAAETVREVPLPERDNADEDDMDGADEDGTIAAEYTLRVRADSTTLWVSVNDVPLFGVEDTFLDGDAAGVFTDGNDATFTSLSANDDADVGRLLKDAFTEDDPIDSAYVSGEETVGDWRVVDEPPYTIRHSMWRTRDGTLEQMSNLYGFVGNRYREPGTYAVTGDENWSDYRVAVRLRSEDDDAIGVIVRYRGDSEYYRFSMDHERKYRRLVRRSGGTTTVLWEDDERYELGREYLLTIDCVGDRIVGYLDGKRLFSVTDPVIDTGKIGVYCRANVGARFEDVRVTAPGGGWVPYHVFEADEELPAGSRIRIADDPPADDELPVGVYARDRNGDDVGRLPGTPTAFRVRDPNGTIGHRRVFLPEEAYESCTDVPVLRNADGTGLLLLTAGLPDDTTATRLSLTYRRAVEGDVLTQHGSDDPETTSVTVRAPTGDDEEV